MMIRLLFLVALGACSVFAQLRLFVLQDGVERAVGAVLSLGGVSIGGSLDVQFLVRNTGSPAETLSILSVAGAAFALSTSPSLPRTLASGATLDFTVRFQPADLGSYSANLVFNNASVILRGVAVVPATVSIDEAGVLRVLNAGAEIDFGDVEPGSSASRRFVLQNQTAQTVTISTLGPSGEYFFLTSGPSPPFTLTSGASVSFEISFQPPPDWKGRAVFQRLLLVDQRQFALRAVAVQPPLPKPQILLEADAPRSAQQSKLVIKLDAPARTSGAGQVEMEFISAIGSPIGDPAILFPSTGNRTANFQIAPADEAAHFGERSAIDFQTGTTAGTIVFTVKLGDYTERASLVIAPASISIDTARGARSATGLDIALTGFDNTRSASELTFTFFDKSGQAIGAGPVRVNIQADFARYFASAELGGVFGLKAAFPVTGPVEQIDSVELQMTNAAGTMRSQKIRF